MFSRSFAVREMSSTICAQVPFAQLCSRIEGRPQEFMERLVRRLGLSQAMELKALHDRVVALLPEM